MSINLSEEAYKIQRLKEEPLYKDALPVQHYDLLDNNNNFIVEFKRDDKAEIERLIFQCLLTASYNNRSYNFYLGDTPRIKKCTYGYSIDTRILIAEKLTPSGYSKKNLKLRCEYKECLNCKEKCKDYEICKFYSKHEGLYQLIKPLITKNLRDFPSIDFVNEVAEFKKTYSLNLNKAPFWKKSLEGWLIKDEDRRKDNAYYTKIDLWPKVVKLLNQSTQENWIDPCAGSGQMGQYLAKITNKKIELRDKNPKILISGGTIKDVFQTFKFGKPVVTNEAFNCFNHIYSTIKNESGECILFNLVNQYPNEEMPIVDGFFTDLFLVSDTGTSKITNTTKVLVAYLDWSKPPVKSKIIDGRLFECTSNSSLSSCRINGGRERFKWGQEETYLYRIGYKDFSPYFGRFVSEDLIKEIENNLPKGHTLNVTNYSINKKVNRNYSLEDGEIFGSRGSGLMKMSEKKYRENLSIIQRIKKQKSSFSFGF